jgi:hypothetical protein
MPASKDVGSAWPSQDSIVGVKPCFRVRGLADVVASVAPASKDVYESFGSGQRNRLLPKFRNARNRGGRYWTRTSDLSDVNAAL